AVVIEQRAENSELSIQIARGIKQAERRLGRYPERTLVAAPALRPGYLLLDPYVLKDGGNRRGHLPLPCRCPRTWIRFIRKRVDCDLFDVGKHLRRPLVANRLNILPLAAGQHVSLSRA